MSLARAVALRGALSRSLACPLASRNASKVRLLATGRLSSSAAHVGAARTRVAAAGGAAARRTAKDLFEARRDKLLRRQQVVRSLGLFADGGGVSHRALKELEKKAARSPSDPNAEVCITAVQQ